MVTAKNGTDEAGSQEKAKSNNGMGESGTQELRKRVTATTARMEQEPRKPGKENGNDYGRA
jgi:hypothetical protein